MNKFLIKIFHKYLLFQSYLSYLGRNFENCKKSHEINYFFEFFGRRGESAIRKNCGGWYCGYWGCDWNNELPNFIALYAYFEAKKIPEFFNSKKYIF